MFTNSIGIFKVWKIEKSFESADYVISTKYIFGESYVLVFQFNH